MSLHPMKITTRPAIVLLLLSLAFLPRPSAIAGDTVQQTEATPLTPSDQASASNERLIGRLQVIADANSTTKMLGQNFVTAVAQAEGSSQYFQLERGLMEIKLRLSSNQEAVGIIELLISRYQAADAAAKAKREEQLDSLTKELTDKFNSNASVKDYDDLLKRISELEASSINPMYGNASQLDARRMENVRNFVSLWQDYLSAKQAENFQRTSSAISQLVQLATQFTAIPRSTLIKIQDAPVGDSSDSQNQTQAKAEFEKIAAKAVNAIDAAKVPADLDATLAELGSYRPGPSQYGQLNSLSARAENAKTFVKGWQDYLVAKQWGRSDQMKTTLHGLASGNYDASFYPRSKILALEEEPFHGAKGMAKDGGLMDPNSLTLDNIKAFSTQLNVDSSTNFQFLRGTPQLQFAVSHLAALIDEANSGNNRSSILASQNVISNISQTGDYSTVLFKLYSQLAFKGLRAELSLPDDLQPAPGEPFGAFLERVLASAVARKDWRLAYRAAEVRKNVGQQIGNSLDEISDYDGFHAMIEAMNLNEAGQWADAVSAYKTALESTGPHIPTKEIGERLAQIQREHPVDYEKAQTLPDYPNLISKILQTRFSAAQRPTETTGPVPGRPGTAGVAPTTGFSQAAIGPIPLSPTGK